jgi:hypothetical protein
VRSSATLEDRSPSDTADTRRGRSRLARLAGAVTGICVVAAAATVWVWASGGGDDRTERATPAKVPVSWERHVVSEDALVQRTGVRLVHVAASGGGGLIDVRFQVVDPDAAAYLHDEATPPAIVDEATGVVANELLMGHSHSGSYTAGVTYYLIFVNPGNLIQRGSRVSVLLGDAQVPNVLVR